jgi:hypothetical protein
MDPALRAAPTPALGLGLCLQDFSVRRRSRLGSLGSLGSLQGLEGLHFGWLHFRLSGTLGSGHLRWFQQLHGVIGFYVILGCRFLHLIHLILISFIHFLQLFLQGLTPSTSSPPGVQNALQKQQKYGLNLSLSSNVRAENAQKLTLTLEPFSKHLGELIHNLQIWDDC